MRDEQQKLEVLFKPSGDGYVFRAPNPWVLGQARHYHVTEAQKAQILKVLYIPQWVIGVFWLVFFLVWFGGGTLLLYFVSGDPNPTTADIVIIIILAILGILLPLPLIGFWQLHRLKPNLQTARPTEERISFREIAKATRKATSVKDYARNCMLSGIAFGAMMANVGMQLNLAITKGSYSTLVLWSAAAILAGFAVIRNGRLAMRKASVS